jgi:hypothetical protein
VKHWFHAHLAGQDRAGSADTPAAAIAVPMTTRRLWRARAGRIAGRWVASIRASTSRNIVVDDGAGPKQLAAPSAVTAEFAATTAAVGIIADLEATLAEHFEAHPDADFYRSLPGLGVILGARGGCPGLRGI